MSLPKWLEILFSIGPTVLAFTPLAPIAGPVAAGIAEARALAGASNSEKLAHVVAIAKEAAVAANAQAGKTILDPDGVSATAGAVISSVVQVVNQVHAASDAAHEAVGTEHVPGSVTTHDEASLSGEAHPAS